MIKLSKTIQHSREWHTHTHTHILSLSDTTAPRRPGLPQTLRFLGHTQWHTTVGRAPLDQGSVHYNDQYLATLTRDKHPKSPANEYHWWRHIRGSLTCSKAVTYCKMHCVLQCYSGVNKWTLNQEWKSANKENSTLIPERVKNCTRTCEPWSTKLLIGAVWFQNYFSITKSC